MAARYSKVERRVWRDEKVARLSRSAPNARELWLYLLTCDSQDAFPGLYILRPSVAADDLGWQRDDVLSLLDEIVAAGLAKFDKTAQVVWLPNAPRKRVDELRNNAKNARGWRNAWDEMPECDLAREAFAAAVEALTDLAEGDPNSAVVKAFASRPPRWLSRKTLDGSQDRSQDGSHPGRNQDKDKEEDKEQQDRVRTREDDQGVSDAIRQRRQLFPGVGDHDLVSWALGLSRDTDLHIPKGVSFAPYLRSALAKTADLVTANASKSNKDRFTFARRAAIGMANDDKANGWASGRTDGREGVCAPSSKPQPSSARGTGSGTDTAYELEQMRRAEQETFSKRKTGGGSALADLLPKIAGAK